jgi:hypothetical protein
MRRSMAVRTPRNFKKPRDRFAAMTAFFEEPQWRAIKYNLPLFPGFPINDGTTFQSARRYLLHEKTDYFQSDTRFSNPFINPAFLLTFVRSS